MPMTGFKVNALDYNQRCEMEIGRVRWVAQEEGRVEYTAPVDDSKNDAKILHR